MPEITQRVQRLLIVGGVASALVLGARMEVTLAQSDQAAASVSQQCVDEHGELTVTVHGEEVVTQRVPDERSPGRGPCVPPGPNR
jgi:hypothetical protein